jgi:TfoX/Sxy family transcriptional regulator of competence genes
MPYSETLANRVRERLAMMGGLTFMVDDKMCVGIMKDELMCRIDPALHTLAVERPGCHTMHFGNRLMKGYVLVDGSGTKTQQDFDYWIDLALDFNPKEKRSKQRK